MSKVGLKVELQELNDSLDRFDQMKNPLKGLVDAQIIQMQELWMVREL